MANRTHTNASATANKPATMSETVARANKQKEARDLIARAYARAFDDIKTDATDDAIVSRIAAAAPADASMYRVVWATRETPAGKLVKPRRMFTLPANNKADALALTRALIVRAYRWAAGVSETVAADMVAETWHAETVIKQTFAKSAPANKTRKARTNKGETTARDLARAGFDLTVKTSKVDAVA